MDPFAFKDDPEPKKEIKLPDIGGSLSKTASRMPGGTIWILGTLYFLFMAGVAVLYFGYTFMNPYHSYNPFSPTNPADLPPTYTPYPPTQTATSPPPSATADPLAFPTLTPTSVLESLNTPTPLGMPTQTQPVLDLSTPTPPPGSGGPFYIVQDGNPIHIAHQDGCDGLYVGGQVFDINGAPQTFMAIRINGLLNGSAVGIEDGFSGTAPSYGPSGYQIRIADAPVDSPNTLFVQLFDPVLEEAVSDIIDFPTYNDCARNLVLINFTQVR